MVLSIKSDEASRLARELAAETGQSLTTAVTDALRERLAVVRRQRNRSAALDRIQETARSRTVLDARPHDEILGYDDAEVSSRGSLLKIVLGSLIDATLALFGRLDMVIDRHRRSVD